MNKQKCFRIGCTGDLVLTHQNIIKHHSYRTGIFGTYINRIYWCDKCKAWTQIESERQEDIKDAGNTKK